MSRPAIRWALAAIAGLVLAAGITLAVSELTSQHVGLYDEPPSAGRDLVVSTPARTTTAPGAKPKRTKRTKRPPAATTTTTAPPATAAPVTPAPTATTDDHGGSSGSGRGRGRGRGSDD